METELCQELAAQRRVLQARGFRRYIGFFGFQFCECGECGQGVGFSFQGVRVSAVSDWGSGVWICALRLGVGFGFWEYGIKVGASGLWD